MNVTSDDRWLFVSDEWAARINVIDLQKTQSSGFKEVSVIGTVPTGSLPIALTLSPDGRYLYTAEVADKVHGANLHFANSHGDEFSTDAV